MRYGSVCSGIEAATVAWHPLGWQPAFFAEIEAFPSAVLAHHYPDVPNLGDMTGIDGAEWRGVIDVLVGGTPCQSFSVAGRRQSLSDDRGNLTLKFVELVHAADPFCVVWENVPGVLSTKDNAFGCFLAGLVGEGQPIVCRDNAWPNAGMAVGPRRSAAWRILDAQYFGLAQRRRRVFVVSFRTGDGINPGAVLFEPESLPRRSPPSRQAGARVAASLTRGADSSGKGGYAGRRQEDDVNIVNCLDRHMGSGGPDDNAAQAGHLVPSDVPEVCPAIKARDCKGPSSDGDGDGAILVPMVAHSLRAEAKPPGSIENSSTTVVTTLAIRGREEDSRFEYRQDGTANAVLMPNGGRAGMGVGAIQAGMAVRRLTPRECERLQGFPDDYTLIPYRGKPAADGPRYRALGNSMAVPVMRWIGERIELVKEAFAERASA